MDPRQAEAFFDEREGTIRGPVVSVDSPQEDDDRGAVHRTYRNRPRSPGPVRATHGKSKTGESPEWERETGMLKAGSDRIAPSGRLLRHIDAEVVPDAEQG